MGCMNCKVPEHGLVSANPISLVYRPHFTLDLTLLFRVLSYVLCLLAVFMTLGCKTKDIPLPDHPGGQIYHGIRRYDVKCYGCHGWLGEGSMHAPRLMQPGVAISRSQFVNAVLYGRANMPAYQSVINEEDVFQIIDWIEKIPR